MSQVVLGITSGGAQPDMGDLEFIQTKVLAGDYFQVTASRNVAGQTIEFVVPNGRTAFMIEAHSIPILSIVTNKSTSELRINGVKKDAVSTFRESNLGQGGNGDFKVLGLSLAGDGIKKIEVVLTSVTTSSTVELTMSGYLV